MDTSWPEKLTSNRERLIKELVQGHELATRLQLLLKEVDSKNGGSGPSVPAGSFVADELVVKILRTFTETLSVINDCPDFEVLSGDDMECRNLAIRSSEAVADPVCTDDRKSESSSETKKRQARERRGSYKRKKIAESWTVVSLTIEDKLAWRKYGQKEILKSKFPRSYYRCTHKYDQGCKATKQVQRMEDGSQMYHITYIGHHVCVSAGQHVMNMRPQDSSTSSGLATMGAYASGSNSMTNCKAEECHSLGSSSSKIKQEIHEMEQQNTTEVNVSSCFEDNGSMWKDVFGSFDHSLDTDYGDLVSTMYSASEDSVIKPHDLNCDFDFDHETQFFCN